MKCRRCKATAVVALPSHNSAFCAASFLDFFSRQVAKGIEAHRLMTKEDKVLVALSGGKDSLALMLELSRQGDDVTGLHIDLAIPGSSPAARGVVERFCDAHGFPLIVRDMAAEGMPIPKVKETLKRPICSACGKIKRYFFKDVYKRQLLAREERVAVGADFHVDVFALGGKSFHFEAAGAGDFGLVNFGMDAFFHGVLLTNCGT